MVPFVCALSTCLQRSMFFGWVSFPRKMVDAAFEWAGKHNLIRRSPIHQEEEAKIILGDSFALKTEEGEESSRTGNMTCEEPRLIR